MAGNTSIHQPELDIRERFQLLLRGMRFSRGLDTASKRFSPYTLTQRALRMMELDHAPSGPQCPYEEKFAKYRGTAVVFAVREFVSAHAGADAKKKAGACAQAQAELIALSRRKGWYDVAEIGQSIKLLKAMGRRKR